MGLCLYILLLTSNPSTLLKSQSTTSEPMKALKILILSHIRSRTSKVEPGFCIALVITSIPELVVKGRIEEGDAGR